MSFEVNVTPNRKSPRPLKLSLDLDFSRMVSPQRNVWEKLCHELKITRIKKIHDASFRVQAIDVNAPGVNQGLSLIHI